ncbi:MAG: DNA-directed RNA polymerase subunit omega [Bacteroidetes bacterium]|nr:DNA-directed RNA polymerase subunit omega [Rhodothermaceae bacterium RA]RMH54080.1 MAG: DNA-directed RNA polymerase subunit omega [Bacteroidota bacterium]
MAIKTLDINLLAAQTGNVYETVAILSKRARQVATNMKAELDEKLSYFEGFEAELEDPRFQEEQARISIEFEKKPEPTEIAINEMLDGEIYFRDPSTESSE